MPFRGVKPFVIAIGSKPPLFRREKKTITSPSHNYLNLFPRPPRLFSTSLLLFLLLSSLPPPPLKALQSNFSIRKEKQNHGSLSSSLDTLRRSRPPGPSRRRLPRRRAQHHPGSSLFVQGRGRPMAGRGSPGKRAAVPRRLLQRRKLQRRVLLRKLRRLRGR